jgi:hypothetical protein
MTFIDFPFAQNLRLLDSGTHSKAPQRGFSLMKRKRKGVRSFHDERKPSNGCLSPLTKARFFRKFRLVLRGGCLKGEECLRDESRIY